MRKKTLYMIAMLALHVCGYCQNMIQNAGCEMSLVNGQIPFWTQTIGNQWGQRSSTQTAAEGIEYFYPGSEPIAELMQTLDLTADAVLIDLGGKTYRFYGSTLSYPQSPPDLSTMYIVFHDRSGNVLSNIFLGPYSSTGAWLKTDTTVKAPVGSRSVDIRLHSIRRTGTSNDGFYDDLFFGRPTVYDTIDTAILFWQHDIRIRGERHLCRYLSYCSKYRQCADAIPQGQECHE